LLRELKVNFILLSVIFVIDKMPCLSASGSEAWYLIVGYGIGVSNAVLPNGHCAFWKASSEKCQNKENADGFHFSAQRQK
jgi:hypothetical protein